MRLNQARNRLADAISAGQTNTDRLEMVQAAAIADYKDLVAEARHLNR